MNFKTTLKPIGQVRQLWFWLTKLIFIVSASCMLLKAH